MTSRVHNFACHATPRQGWVPLQEGRLGPASVAWLTYLVSGCARLPHAPRTRPQPPVSRAPTHRTHTPVASISALLHQVLSSSTYGDGLMKNFQQGCSFMQCGKNIIWSWRSLFLSDFICCKML